MILGISAFYHDSAAAVIDGHGRIVAAAQEERFSRKKHDFGFPRQAVRYCLGEAGIGVADLELVAFYEQPWVKFERILETHLAHAPVGIRPYLKAMPVWLKEKLWIGRIIERELDYEGRIIYPEHHESHAASAFYPSPFDEAAILTMDGVGEWATATWGLGSGTGLDLRRELRFPHSLGLLYSAFTYYTGFRVNSGEYKVMGLAPYGQPKYADLILDELMDLRPDGSFRLNLEYFNYTRGLTMTSPAFHALFGGPPRKPESELTERHMDLARSVQEVTEEVMLRMARHARAETGARNLCMAGGVALNSVGNGKIIRAGIFDDVWIQPAAGDAGGAVGAALFAHHRVLERPRAGARGPDGPGPDREGEDGDGRDGGPGSGRPGDAQQGSYLGPAYGSEAIGAWLDRHDLPYQRMAPDALDRDIAERLASRQIVGWFGGRMEFGPRALGARSILADARDPEAQRTLNLKIKYRESFRPFAPACLEERAGEWFDLDRPSPYMLVVSPVREDRRRTYPEDAARGLERLRLELSDVPAVTHVDYSARVQTVGTEPATGFRRMLETFEARTGCPMVVNTSFNRRGEPIVCTPGDAYACFMQTEMDVLVLEDHVLLKRKQPPAGDLDLEALAEDWRPGEDDADPGPDRAGLRRFAFLLAAAFGALGGFLMWRGHSPGPYLLGLAALLGLAGLLVPGRLGPVYRGWMAFAERLARITNTVLLTLVFVLVVTPIALAMRLARRDRLRLRETAGTYWVEPDREGAEDRWDRPY